LSSPHILLVMSHYSDPELSRRRLNIFRATLAPSLASQTRKPLVHIVVNPRDPLAEERTRAIDSTGCRWRAIERAEWKLYGEDWELPSGRKLVSRCDDDDVLCRDFSEATYRCFEVARRECAIVWPNNYTYWRGQLFRWRNKSNQFISLSTSLPIDPHYMQHGRIKDYWTVVTASAKRGAIWVRHGDSESSTPRGCRRRRQQASRRERATVFARYSVRLSSIDEAIAESGRPSAHPREPAKASRSDECVAWGEESQSQGRKAENQP
jgi:hypothetical protein